MSRKSKRNGGGTPKTVHIDGHPHKQYTIESKSTFVTKHVLTPQQMDEVREMAKRAHVQAVSDWLTANLGAQVTGDVQEYLQAIAPITGRLNS